jgi:hypothetical protein
MPDSLTHSIPVFTFSTNLVDFIESKQKKTAGKKMINEHFTVVPQYIVEHYVAKKTKLLEVNSTGNGAAAFEVIPAQHIHYLSYYGEYLCTEQEYNEWKEKNKPKKG